MSKHAIIVLSYAPITAIYGRGMTDNKPNGAGESAKMKPTISGDEPWEDSSDDEQGDDAKLLNVGHGQTRLERKSGRLQDRSTQWTQVRIFAWVAGISIVVVALFLLAQTRSGSVKDIPSQARKTLILSTTSHSNLTWLDAVPDEYATKSY